MNEVPLPPSSRRRHVRDGLFALLMLSLAIFSGYALLSPPVLLARPLPSGSVLAMVRPVAAIIEPRLPVTPPWPQWPARITGRVLDPQFQPLAAAAVVIGGREIRTGADGAFALDKVPASAPLIVKLPGYEKMTLDPSPAPEPLELVLVPHVVKAAYLTYFGVADRGIRGRVLELLSRTELNAVVIDIKGDRGWIPYRTEVASARAAGAQGPVIIKDFDRLLADLKARGVYTIARIVTFKDNVLARHRPDLAVIDTQTGMPWVDRENLAWVDPFREEVWAYNIEIAKEAARKGFH